MSHTKKWTGRLARTILLALPLLAGPMYYAFGAPDVVTSAAFTCGFLWCVVLFGHFRQKKSNSGVAQRENGLPLPEQCAEFPPDENTPPWMRRLP